MRNSNDSTFGRIPRIDANCFVELRNATAGAIYLTRERSESCAGFFHRQRGQTKKKARPISKGGPSSNTLRLTMTVRTATAAMGTAAATAAVGSCATAGMRAATTTIAAARSRVRAVGRGIRTARRRRGVRARLLRRIPAIVGRRASLRGRVRATATCIGCGAGTSPRRAIIRTRGHGGVIRGAVSGTAEALGGLAAIGCVALCAPVAGIVAARGLRTILRELVLARVHVSRAGSWVPRCQTVCIHRVDPKV